MDDIILAPNTVVYHKGLGIKGIVLSYDSNVPNNLGNHGTFIKLIENSESGHLLIDDVFEVSTNLLEVIK